MANNFTYLIFLDDVVAIFKPYGIPMFGDSNHVSHSVEKYQNALCSATKADTLYEVRASRFTSRGKLPLS